MDQVREVRSELDEIVMQAVRLESGEACSFRTGLQSGQFPSAIGAPPGNQTLVIAHFAYETD